MTYWLRLKDFFKSSTNIQLTIILVFLFLTVLYFTRIGVDLRSQRLSLLMQTVIFCGGAFIFFFRSKPGGLLVLYASVLSLFLGIDIQTATVMICAIVLYIALSSYEGEREKIYDFFIFVAAVNVVFQASQWYGLQWITYAEETKDHWPGLMANRNETSALYAITGAACLRYGRLKFIPIIIIGLLLSKSLGGVLAFSAMMTLWTVRNTHYAAVLRAGKYPAIKWAAPVGMIAGIFAFVMFFGTVIHPFNIEHRKTERFFIWEVTAKVATYKPLGWGMWQYEIVIPLITSWYYMPEDERSIRKGLVRHKAAYEQAVADLVKDDPTFLTGSKQQTAQYSQAHNEYVQWFFAAGYPGLILGLYFLAWSLWTAYKNIDPVPFYGIIAASVSAMTFHIWQIVPLMVITLLYLAFTRRGQMDKKTAIKACRLALACPEGIEWLHNTPGTPEELWNKCEMGSWMIGLAARAGVDREKLVAVCDCCLSLTMAYGGRGYEPPKILHENVMAVKTDPDPTHAAANCIIESAHAIKEVSGRTDGLKLCADIVRKHITWEEVEAGLLRLTFPNPDKP